MTMTPGKGIIFAYMLDGKGGATHVEASDINALPAEGATLWLHLNYGEDEALDWMYTDSGLDPLICDALVAEDTRPRYVLTGGGILMTLRGVNFNPGSDPEDMVSVRVWVEPGRILSMRQRRVRSAIDIASALDSGMGPLGPGDFIAMLAERITDRMGDIIGEIDGRVDDLEGSVVDTESHVMRSELSDIRRKAISLRKYIVPQRDMLNRLYSDRQVILLDTEKARLRESGERTARYVEDLDSARDRAAITHEELISRQTEQMNRIMYMLSIVAVIFLPLSFITGLLGINVGGIPGTQSKIAFAVVCVIMIVIALAEYVYFRSRKML